MALNSSSSFVDRAVSRGSSSRSSGQYGNSAVSLQYYGSSSSSFVGRAVSMGSSTLAQALGNILQYYGSSSSSFVGRAVSMGSSSTSSGQYGNSAALLAAFLWVEQFLWVPPALGTHPQPLPQMKWTGCIGQNFRLC